MVYPRPVVSRLWGLPGAWGTVSCSCAMPPQAVCRQEAPCGEALATSCARCTARTAAEGVMEQSPLASPLGVPPGETRGRHEVGHVGWPGGKEETVC